MNGEDISFKCKGGKYDDYVVDEIGGYSIVHEINDFVRCLSEFKNIDDCVYDKLFTTLETKLNRYRNEIGYFTSDEVMIDWKCGMKVIKKKYEHHKYTKTHIKFETCDLCGITDCEKIGFSSQGYIICIHCVIDRFSIQPKKDIYGKIYIHKDISIIKFSKKCIIDLIPKEITIIWKQCQGSILCGEFPCKEGDLREKSYECENKE